MAVTAGEKKKKRRRGAESNLSWVSPYPQEGNNFQQVITTPTAEAVTEGGGGDGRAMWTERIKKSY